MFTQVMDSMMTTGIWLRDGQEVPTVAEGTHRSPSVHINATAYMFIIIVFIIIVCTASIVALLCGVKKGRQSMFDQRLHSFFNFSLQFLFKGMIKELEKEYEEELMAQNKMSDIQEQID